MFGPRHARDVDDIVDVIDGSLNRRWLQQISRNCFDRQAGYPIEVLPEWPNETSDVDAAPQKNLHRMTADESRAAGYKRGANVLNLLPLLVVSLTFPRHKSIFKKAIISKAAYKLCSLFSPIINGVPIGSI